MTDPTFKVGDLVRFTAHLSHYHNSIGLITAVKRTDPLRASFLDYSYSVQYHYKVLVTHPELETPRFEYLSAEYLILIPT